MRALRQDAWTEEDDRVLAEIVLRHIQQGSTQLAAFEECAGKLGRTPAACGYRWNACVRKRYEAGIELAKAQRKQAKTEQKRTIVRQPDDRLKAANISWSDVFRFLKERKQQDAVLVNRIRLLERDLDRKQKELQELTLVNRQLADQLQKIGQEHERMKEDYMMLVKIMERARKLTLFSPDGDDLRQTATRFRMDANGNLERM